MTKYTITQTELENSEKISLRAEQIIKNLHNRLWQLRAEVGISQIALGEELGISGNQISTYETGIPHPHLHSRTYPCPSPEVLYSYSKFFGISIHEILFGENTDYPVDASSSTKERTCNFLLNVAAIIHNCFEAKEDPS